MDGWMDELTTGPRPAEDDLDVFPFGSDLPGRATAWLPKNPLVEEPSLGAGPCRSPKQAPLGFQGDAR
jgi:hypothetical protein